MNYLNDRVESKCKLFSLSSLYTRMPFYSLIKKTNIIRKDNLRLWFWIKITALSLLNLAQVYFKLFYLFKSILDFIIKFKKKIKSKIFIFYIFFMKNFIWKVLRSLMIRCKSWVWFSWFILVDYELLSHKMPPEIYWTQSVRRAKRWQHYSENPAFYACKCRWNQL